MSGKTVFHLLHPSPLGHFGLVWSEGERSPKVRRIFLPRRKDRLEGLLKREFPGSHPSESPVMVDLARGIEIFLEGEDIRFDLRSLALDICLPFQKRVLLAEYVIPRGWISTYGRVARSIGVPGGARAVGQALAKNPFPIVIPCHRAIRSDGALGGFQGMAGVLLKRTLLELEGIEFTPGGKVLMAKIYY